MLDTQAMVRVVHNSELWQTAIGGASDDSFPALDEVTEKAEKVGKVSVCRYKTIS